MKYRIEKEIRDKVFHRQDAITLWSLVRSLLTIEQSEICLRVFFANGEEYRDDTGKLLGEDILEQKSITKLYYQLRSNDYRKSVAIKITNSGSCYYNESCYEIESDEEDWYLSTIAKLDEAIGLVERKRDIWSFVSRYVSPIAYINVIFWCVCVVYSDNPIIAFFKGYLGRLGASAFITCLIVLPITIAANANKLRPKVEIEFCTKKGRDNTTIDIRSIIINAVISIITGLIVWGITR